MGRKVSEAYRLAKVFGENFAKTATEITIEKTPYRNRPYELIVWTVYNDKPHKLHSILMTAIELTEIYQSITRAYEEYENGKPKKTNGSTTIK